LWTITHANDINLRNKRHGGHVPRRRADYANAWGPAACDARANRRGEEARDIDMQTRDEEVVRAWWSPAQIVSLVVGIGFVVLGAAALAKTGTSHLYTPQDRVWHLSHSPLLGWIEVGFGVLLIVAGAVPGGLRILMALLGAASLAFGIIVVTDAATRQLHRWLGVEHANGWLFVGVGAVLLVAAIAAPTFYVQRRTHGGATPLAA
jgi:hypothetical protein